MPLHLYLYLYRGDAFCIYKYVHRCIYLPFCVSGLYLQERDALRKTRPWVKALATKKSEVFELFKLWDTSGDGKVDKGEFRRGIAKLGFDAPIYEINEARLYYDHDELMFSWC